MVHIIDDYYVDADERQYIVGKKITRSVNKTNKETGENEVVEEITLQNSKYYPTLIDCVKYVHNLYQRRCLSDFNGNLADVIVNLQDIKEQFQDILDDKLNKELSS